MVPRGGGAPERRAQQRGAETRQRILEAALKAFASHGFEGALTRDIAAAAGVHQPVINYYFDGKEGLWEAAIDFAFEELRATFAARLREIGGEDPVSTFRALLRDFVLFNARHPEFPRVLLHVGSAPSPRLDWIAERHLRPMQESILQLIETLRADGHGPAIPALNFYHIMNAAAASIFVMAPAVARVSQENPLSTANSAAHADAVVELFFPRLREAATPLRSRSRRGGLKQSEPTGSPRVRRRKT